jgi:UDP-N-acetylglucosamine--N-acetylmuramyl-(pentapeptide) pyrophosphoryl-undecaprenol N-acetylglucosamine transferase
MSSVMQKPIVVMAGGTGGHVFPALVVAEKLRQRGEVVIWFGTRSGIEARVVPAADIAIEWLNVQGLRGKGTATLLLAPFRLIRACWQALQMLRRIQPKAVLGMGGFVSGPGGLMAWLLNIPLYLHEQNSIVGLTNRILSRFATRSYFAFPDAATKIPRSEYLGNPVREEIAAIDEPDARLLPRINQPLQVLIIGGSLGAASLNRFLPLAIACLDGNQRPQVRHQCGEKHLQVCQQNYQAAGVKAEVVSFIDDMPEAYAWADLVVCRAGAITVSELTAAGLGSLLIPFPFAVDNHQYYNALFLQQHNAAQILLESDLSAESLALKLQYFQQNRPMLIEMAKQARSLYHADATERLVQGLLGEEAA